MPLRATITTEHGITLTDAYIVIKEIRMDGTTATGDVFVWKDQAAHDAGLKPIKRVQISVAQPGAWSFTPAYNYLASLPYLSNVSVV
jgi:hypothetical protein